MIKSREVSKLVKFYQEDWIPAPIHKLLLVTDGYITTMAYRRKSDGRWTGWMLLDDTTFGDVIAWAELPVFNNTNRLFFKKQTNEI